MLPALTPSTTALVGNLAAVLTTASFFPQVVKTWRSRSAGDLSIAMLAVFSVGVFLWLIYGLALGSGPIIYANGLTLAQSAVLVGLRIRYGKS
jgi:MtN3 and saliva related transmembrane protein